MSNVYNFGQPFDSLDEKESLSHAERLRLLLVELRERAKKSVPDGDGLYTISDFKPDPVEVAITKEIVNLGKYLNNQGGSLTMRSVFLELEEKDERAAWALDKYWSGIGTWLA